MKNAIKNTTLADRALLTVFVLASLAGMLYSREAVSKGEDVLIEINGSLAYTLSLSENRELTVNGSHGPATIEIKDGMVRMKQSDCNNHLCEKQGWIRRGSIICLPNGIAITIGGRARKDVDAVTG